ncbi:MAG TPA: hypothetical protein PLB25_13850 [Rhodoferax sp.]|nr:hypothetical protein [Rhodoferax sp.]
MISALAALKKFGAMTAKKPATRNSAMKVRRRKTKSRALSPVVVDAERSEETAEVDMMD